MLRNTTIQCIVDLFSPKKKKKTQQQQQQLCQSINNMRYQCIRHNIAFSFLKLPS